ncbi:PREDICTED: adenylate kinase 7-like isoform X1 [Branchiostoma belcheri]|uniref:Adenylate kinase 7-like isoform X1 n=1 Tax=Branchiostoma belcheri TaxID=7741 RepID=A0A6P4Z2L2_BRABE|nr:PREDICTED: adenylate kinase 7-like isoform X1 [Branchiostoma belcheri]
MADAIDDKPQTKRIFVNHVDAYSGKNLSKFLSDCVVGSSLEEAEEGSEGEEDRGSDYIPPSKEGTYTIIGTLQNPANAKPDWVKEVVQYAAKEELADHLMECDIIIYDITEDPDQIDEATWACSALHAELEHFDNPKMFILLSSVMTWAKSKPLDPDDPEIPFTEDDYRRRKPHPNFKNHISAEKLVIKNGKTNKGKFVTYVVAAGLAFGMGESIFHFLFKAAWEGKSPALQVFGTGTNIVPTIHIKDLAGVLQNICDQRPKTRYIVAVDDSQNTLEEIVRAIASNLGNGKVKKLSKEDYDFLKHISTHLGDGKVKHVTKEEALLSKDLAQADFDQLLVNLRMEAMFVKESMRIMWIAETGMCENIDTVIREYKQSRGLLPMRGCIMGPPAVGKTTIAKKLCEHYKLHHIKVKDVIDEAVENLKRLSARADEGEEEEDDGKAQEAQELLDAIQESRENNNDRIEDQYIIRFYREKLRSMPCQNQGFILDGFPKTYEQAKELFAVDDEEEGEDEGGKVPSYHKGTMPEVVISLDAPDDFLKVRVMNLPEGQVAGTHNTEEGLTRRLTEFRNINREDETILNYFDELEIHPDHIDVSKDVSDDMRQTVDKIIKTMGEPRNYGPTPEELEEMERKATEERLKREAQEQEERERKEAEEAAERARRQEEWAERLEEVRRQEQEVLEAQSTPLRNYLMKHVMPTLTQGLIEACKVRPDDPVDFLAEYLFKSNPQVD